MKKTLFALLIMGVIWRGLAGADHAGKTNLCACVHATVGLLCHAQSLASCRLAVTGQATCRDS